VVASRSSVTEVTFGFMQIEEEADQKLTLCSEARLKIRPYSCVELSEDPNTCVAISSRERLTFLFNVSLYCILFLYSRISSPW